jgi:hypothetical protein
LHSHAALFHSAHSVFAARTDLIGVVDNDVPGGLASEASAMAASTIAEATNASPVKVATIKSIMPSV